MISDKGALPLVVWTTPANVPDQEVFLAMLDAMPPIKMPSGQFRYKPDATLGDRAYGTKDIIAEVVERRVQSLLAPRGSKVHGSGLGKVRYVIERTLNWMDNYRRLKLCCETTGTHWQAMNELAACVICANRIQSLKVQGKMAA